MFKKLFEKKDSKKDRDMKELFETIDTINMQLDDFNRITMNKINKLNNVISEMQRA